MQEKMIARLIEGLTCNVSQIKDHGIIDDKKIIRQCVGVDPILLVDRGSPRVSFLQKKARLRKKWARNYDPVGFYWAAPLRAAFERARNKKELSAGEMITIPKGCSVDFLDSGKGDPCSPPSLIVRQDIPETAYHRVKINITGQLLDGTGVSLEDMAATLREAREKLEQTAAGLPVRKIALPQFDPFVVAQCGEQFKAVFAGVSSAFREMARLEQEGLFRALHRSPEDYLNELFDTCIPGLSLEALEKAKKAAGHLSAWYGMSIEEAVAKLGAALQPDWSGLSRLRREGIHFDWWDRFKIRVWQLFDSLFPGFMVRAQGYILDKIEGINRHRFKAFRRWVSVQARKIRRLFRCWK